MNSKLLEHLRGRQIASILEESNETTDCIALKVMTIIDHKLEEKGVYTEIRSASDPNLQQPNDGSDEDSVSLRVAEIPVVSKLLKQLLGIKLFGKFHFFKYIPPIKKFNFILKCRHCSLIGPYFIVLSHMVLSHGTHVGSKQCQWCKATDLKEHIAKNTLEECYKKYLQKESIDNPSYPSVIIRFYDMIESLAEQLGVLTIRLQSFTGEGKAKKEVWFFDGADQDVVVYRHRRPPPIKHLDKLNSFFKQAISAYYGNSRILEFMPQENPAAIEVDGQENGASVTPTPRRTRKRRQTQRDSIDSQNNNASSSSVRSESVPETASKRSSMNFGQTIDEFIENIPNDAMKINAKLKVQAVVLKFSKKAYEERINREHE